MGRLKNTLLLKWLAVRIPRHRHHALSLNSVFILPTRFGLCMLVLGLCLFVLGTNYQNNLLLLLSFFFLALQLLALFASYQNFARLQVQATGVDPVFAGEQAHFQLQLTSPGDQRPCGMLQIAWWGHKEVTQVDLDAAPTRLLLPRPTYRRGCFPLPRVTFSSLYPLGWFRCWTHLDFDQPMTVYPALKPAALALQPATGDAEQQAQGTPGTEDFAGLRNYTPGDPLQRIVWKNVAKGGAAVVKQFDEPDQQAGYLVLNTSHPQREQHISELAFQIVELSRQRQPFGLKAGPQQIAVATGQAHRDRCLHALAMLPGAVT